jgi:hypothetical protein
VHEAAEISAARFLWQPNAYDLVMLDFHRYSSDETLEFYGRVKDASPAQRFAFLMGAPLYLSLTWPGEVAVDSALRGQWAEAARRVMAAA